MPTLGDKIRKRRKRAGLTQGQLAKMVGISQPSLFKLENDKNGPTYETLMELERVLGPLREAELSGKKFEIDEDIYKTINEPEFKIMFQMYQIMQHPKTIGNRRMGELIAKQLRLIAETVRFCKSDAGVMGDLVRSGLNLQKNPENEKTRAFDSKKHKINKKK